MKKLVLLFLAFMLCTFSVHANVSDWAVDDFEKAERLGFISDELQITDFTESISREKFCELGFDFLRTCARSSVNHLKPTAAFSDTSNLKILYLAEVGIIAGRGNGVFAPLDSITREEAAAILCRMAGFMGYDAPSAVLLDIYSDREQISNWALGDVYVMYQMGVMNGVSHTEFSPKTTYTAEQAVSTMVRMFEFFEDNLLFVDGEQKADANCSVKYNTSVAWIERDGAVLHRCYLSDYYGYFCYFEGDSLRISLLSREGFSEVYDSDMKNLLFTASGKLVSANENGITVELNGTLINYDFSGNES